MDLLEEMYVDNVWYWHFPPVFILCLGNKRGLSILFYLFSLSHQEIFLKATLYFFFLHFFFWSWNIIHIHSYIWWSQSNVRRMCIVCTVRVRTEFPFPFININFSSSIFIFRVRHTRKCGEMGEWGVRGQRDKVQGSRVSISPKPLCVTRI